MKCPTCGGKTACYDSRDKGSGRWRRRVCTACGRKFTTMEYELPKVVSRPARRKG